MTGVDTETTDPSEVKLGFADILERIRRLTPTITDRHEDIDSARRLPSDLVAALRDTGVFRAAMPLAWGGPELSSMEQILLIEELAQADGSVGWCAMIGMDSGIYSGYLRPDVAREMFPRLDMVTAGWIPPMGRAHEVDGGYRVEGHWRFGSGCTHADVLGAGCTVFRDGAPLLDEEGKPTWRVLMADPASFVIDEASWNTTGLLGTGSCDYTVADLFVPEEHSFSFTRPYRVGPLHQRSDAILRKMPGVPLGVARAAIDYVYDIADRKTDQPGISWRRSQRVQMVVAECETKLLAARAAVFATVEAQWERLVGGQPLTPQERAAAALARYNAFRAARDITSTLFDLVGGDAIYRGRTPLDRQLHDMVTACQHVVGQSRITEWAGQLLMGSEPDTAFI